MNLGTSFQELADSKSLNLPGNLSHPRNYRRFLAEADGVTMIMDRLEKFVPDGVRRIILWPGADRQLFFPRKRDETFLASLGIPRGASSPSATTAMFTPPTHGKCAAFIWPPPFFPPKEYRRRWCAPGKNYRPFLEPDDKWARESLS